MNQQTRRNTGRKAVLLTQRITWAAFLLFLPITSFPFFPDAIGGEALVRPLSLYPLAILTILFVLPRLFSHPMPRSLLSLLPFVLIAIASSLLSLLRGIEPAMGISATARALRGIFTLAIGCAIYLAVTLLPRTNDDLRFSLRWIYIGCGLALFWGSLQAIYILKFDSGWFNWLSSIQRVISIRRLLVERISGLTYEPHWFADQITTLLLPGVLASILYGETVFRWRWRWLTVEWLLLGWAVILLPFTYSRSGVFNLIMLTVLAILTLRLLPKIQKLRMRNSGGKSANWPKNTTNSPWPWKELASILLALLCVSAPIYWAGSRNSFFARIWEYWQQDESARMNYLSYLGMDARLAYSQAALNTYEAFPFLGVGLGNYAFYLEEMLPYRPLANMPEVLRMITPENGRDRLVTAKNFYLRLLAETGIIGASAFVAFVIAHLGSTLFLWLSNQREQNFWGAISLLGLIAFGMSAFSFDSFVIPNMWVVFGLISAALQVTNHCNPPHKQGALA
ncbi:MAG: O-antigen ligase family protein [Chloroflexota bacterium]